MEKRQSPLECYHRWTGIPYAALAPLMDLSSPAFEYGVDLVRRGADSETIRFVLDAVNDPEKAYEGILAAYGDGKSGVTLDMAAARYLGDLPNGEIRGRILLLPEPSPLECLFSDVKRRVLENICEETPLNLDESRHLLRELHSSSAVVPVSVYARATGADPFFIEAIMQDVGGPRVRSALWLYARRGVDPALVMRLMSLPEERSELYNNFFLLSESFAQLGWQRFINDYAELYLAGISQGKVPEEYLRLIN